MPYFLVLFFLLASNVTYSKELQGSWASDCEPYGRHAIISNITFNGGRFEALGTLYQKPGCAVKTVKAVFKGTYTTGSQHGEGTEFNYTSEQFTLTLLKPEVVQHYNRNKICDYDDWALNAPKNILGQTGCVGLIPPNKDQTVYDIFRLKSDNDLRFFSFPIGNHKTNKNQRPKKIEDSTIRLWRVCG